MELLTVIIMLCPVGSNLALLIFLCFIDDFQGGMNEEIYKNLRV